MLPIWRKIGNGIIYENKQFSNFTYSPTYKNNFWNPQICKFEEGLTLDLASSYFIGVVFILSSNSPEYA